MHALGPDWMDPQYLLDTYGTAFFWISLVIVFVECGLFFPILPGDSLLFAIGIFIAGGELDIPLVVAIPALFVAAFAGNVVGYEIGRAIGAPLRHHDGQDRPQEVPRPDPRLLREARREGPGHRPLRADRAHLHHAGGGDRPDGPPPLLHLVGRRRRPVGHLASPSPATSSAGSRSSATTSRPRSSLIVVPLGAADGLRVPQAPPRGEGRCGRGRRGEVVRRGRRRRPATSRDTTVCTHAGQRRGSSIRPEA